MYHLACGEQPENPTQSQQSQAKKSSSQPKQNNSNNINNQAIQSIQNMYACMNAITTRCIWVHWLVMTILCHMKLY